MSIIVSNTSIKYGGISTITVNNLLNVRSGGEKNFGIE